MITRETAADSADAKNRQTENGSNNQDALRRMHDDIDAIRTADKTVGSEMTKVKIVCDPPPITPQCHGVDQPLDPAIVTGAMLSLNTSAQKLQDELDSLRPNAAAAGKKFELDFGTLSTQVQNFSLELAKLNTLTKLTSPQDPSYDKEAVLSETEKIDKLAKGADKTRKQMEKDLQD